MRAHCPSTSLRLQAQSILLRMAAVSISPAVHRIGMMSNRRAPLANNPNAANSPYRAVAAAAQKRSREQTDAQEDLSHDHLPPAKRQAVAADHPTLRTPTRRHPLQNSEGRLFNKRPSNGQPTAFERRLLASKSKHVDPKDEIQEKTNDSLDNIRQWQRHYRKVFPYFVFYFESIPDDVRAKCSKAIRALGAVSLISAVAKCRCQLGLTIVKL